MSESTVVEIQVTPNIKVTTGNVGEMSLALLAHTIVILASMSPSAPPAHPPQQQLRYNAGIVYEV